MHPPFWVLPTTVLPVLPSLLDRLSNRWCLLPPRRDVLWRLRSRRHTVSRVVCFELAPVSEQRPHGAYIFVCQSHCRDIRVPAGEQLGQPSIVLSTLSLAARFAERAPWISSVRRYASPRLLIPSSVGLPPLECCRGTSPNQADTWRPCRSSWHRRSRRPARWPPAGRCPVCSPACG